MTEVQQCLLNKCEDRKTFKYHEYCDQRLVDIVYWLSRRARGIPGSSSQEELETFAYELAYYIARMKNL